MSNGPQVAVVVGTGVIGTIYAAVLGEQGWGVRHLVRQGTSRARPKSVDVDLLDLRKGHKRHRRWNHEFCLTETFPADAEFVLVPVRLYQLDGVLKDLAAMPEKVTAVIFTTNWAGLSPLDEALPAGNYILADAIGGGAITGNKLTATIKPLLPLGAVHPDAETRAESMRNVFTVAGLAPKHEQDILHWHWIQYALNAAMWPALVEAGTVRALVKDNAQFQRMLATVREALRVCEARGVLVREYPEARVFLNEGSGVTGRVRSWIMREVYGTAVVHSDYHRRCMLHALSDPAEIATAYGAVLATGHELGCQMTAFDSFKDSITRFRQARR